MFRVALLLLLCVAGAVAQSTDEDLYTLPEDVAKYLLLDSSQRQQITEINLRYARLERERILRMILLQREIMREMALEAPDALAIGQRYVEMETIRRELTTEWSRTVQAVQALLTTTQRQKLSTLEDVFRLEDTAYSAIYGGFIEGNLLGGLGLTGLMSEEAGRKSFARRPQRTR